MNKIKVNDKVRLLAGKDKGKEGKVLQILPKLGLVVVEGINLRYKHARPRKQGEKGQRIQFNAPVPSSRVALVCPGCGPPTRVGFQINTEKSASKATAKQRICRKCKVII